MNTYPSRSAIVMSYFVVPMTILVAIQLLVLYLLKYCLPSSSLSTYLFILPVICMVHGKRHATITCKKLALSANQIAAIQVVAYSAIITWMYIACRTLYSPLWSAVCVCFILLCSTIGEYLGNAWSAKRRIKYS